MNLPAETPRPKILAAMSGGVDSSVAAGLLVERGYDVEGAFMKNWINEPGIVGDCPWEQEIEDARHCADRLGIPFRIVNLMDDYKTKVVEYLLQGYRTGVTPNPDVMCNREIKFGVFLRWALDHGFDAVATGHYARNPTGPHGPELWEGSDPNKDQSYFLALLRPPQIARALFPVGDLLKQQVRQEATRMGLANAAKKDSQGICFIGQVKMRDFLAAYLPEKPGEIIAQDGRVMGRHRGLHFYTLGQRRGIGVACPIEHHAYVVVEKREPTNQLVLAIETPDTPRLYARCCEVGDLSWAGPPLLSPARCLIRARYRAPKEQAQLEQITEDTWRIEFDRPQRALTPGQICAFYDGPKLLGGSTVRTVIHLS